MPPATSFFDSARYRTKERAPRACNRCRGHKVRCDAFAQPTGICSACVSSGTECSFGETSNGATNEPWPRTAAPQWYVESLEERVERLEALLQKLHPGETFTDLGPPVDIGNWTKPTPATATAARTENPIIETDSMTKLFEDLHIDKMKQGTEEDPRYYGTSSNASFMKKTIFSKMEKEGTRWPEWLARFRSQQGREEKFKMPEWQRTLFIPDKPTRFTFPPEDLIMELIGHYFEHENVILPVLHRPTFTAMVKSRLYERDQNFAGVVLMVCACGARRTNDRRAWAGDVPYSAGWHYYRQVHRMPRSLVEPISLFRLQLYALMVVFLSGECLTSLEWALLGTGLRYAVDVGAHMKRSSQSVSQAERELWKRSFWALFVLDQLLSYCLGRTAVIPIEEIDQELPLEVDDDFWYHPDPSEAFKQPSNIPSSISSFNAFIRLMHFIPKMTLTARYNTPATVQLALDHVADLDSSLRLWLEDLPPHLQLDGPFSKDPKFYRQSTEIHGLYHMTVILAHRSFIPPPSEVAKSDSPALALCTNAARSCVRVVHKFSQRYAEYSSPWMWMTAGNAGMILILNFWLAEQQGRTKARILAAEDIKQCVEIIYKCSHRQHVALQLGDMIRELCDIGSGTQPPAPATLKRTRPADDLGVSTRSDSVKMPRTGMQMSVSEIPPSVGYETERPMEGFFHSSLGSGSGSNGESPESSGTSSSTDSWVLTGGPPVDDGQALLNALFPTGLLPGPAHFPPPGDAQNVMDLWSGTSMGTDWSIWDHFLVNPDLPAPFGNP